MSDRARSSETILAFADRLRSAKKAQPEQLKTFESWVTFRISNRSLALPVTHVREILRLTELTGVPNAPHPVAGVMNLRGHVLPVVDSHALLGLSPQLPTHSSRVLVFQLNDRAVGLIADEVAGLEKLQAELIQSPNADESLSEVARGIFPREDDESLLLLDPTRLLAGENLAHN